MLRTRTFRILCLQLSFLIRIRKLIQVRCKIWASSDLTWKITHFHSDRTAHEFRSLYSKVRVNIWIVSNLSISLKNTHARSSKKPNRTNKNSFRSSPAPLLTVWEELTPFIIPKSKIKSTKKSYTNRAALIISKNVQKLK